MLTDAINMLKADRWKTKMWQGATAITALIYAIALFIVDEPSAFGSVFAVVWGTASLLFYNTLKRQNKRIEEAAKRLDCIRTEFNELNDPDYTGVDLNLLDNLVVDVLEHSGEAQKKEKA
jgi:hypothetical protein